MNQSDLDYYRARAAEEELAAGRAAHPAAAESHRRMAGAYALRVAEAEIEGGPLPDAGHAAFA